MSTTTKSRGKESLGFSDITPEEFQRIVLRMKTSEALSKLFGCSSSELSSYMEATGLMYPVSYMRSLSRETLLEALSHYRSTAKLSQVLGVSESTLLKELVRVPSIRQLQLLPPEGVKIPEMAMQLNRLGSVSLVAAAWGVSDSEVRRQAKEAGVSVTEEQRLEKRGRFETGKGRRAELAYIARRGTAIVVDMTMVDTQADYDAMDTVWGRVNVKGSKQMLSSGKEVCWKFSLSGSSKCDYFALMLFDSRWGRDRYCIMMGSSIAVGRSMTSITVHSRALKGIPLKGTSNAGLELLLESKDGIDGEIKDMSNS